jgi:DNA gyrase subunit A
MSYGVLLVNRKKIQPSTIKALHKQIKNNEIVCIFPEGTALSIKLKEGKNGASFFAARHEIPIIPIAIFGTEKALPALKRFKRTNINTYRSQRRGGRGVQGAGSREEDFVEHLFTATNHSYILFFTDRGKCYWVKVYDIPEGGRAAKGRAIINLIECEPDEKVNAFIAVKDFSEDHYVVMATEKGKVKKTVLSAYSHPRKKGIYAVEIREGDKLIEARVSTGDNDILLGTRNGKSIRFSEQQIRPSGRKTMGVKGITLSSKDDKVVGMLLIKREGTTVLVATENGFGKRTDISQYRPQRRGGKGVLTMKTTDRVGKMIAIKEAIDSDDLMIITTRGVLIRQPVSKIRAIGRATQGVKLINLDKGSKVASITRIISDDEKEPETDEPNSKESEED